MTRRLLLAAMLLGISAGASTGDDYKPPDAERLRTKVPNFFRFDYEFGPEAGKRLWLRVDDRTWIERYPSGKEERFQILGVATVDEREGIVVERSSDKGLRVFIPDKGQEEMDLKFREPGEDGPWSLLGEMQQVE